MSSYTAPTQRGPADTGRPPGQPPEGLARLGSLWWMSVVAGVLLVLWGLLVLTLRPAAVTSLAVLAGISFILGGVIQLVVSARVDELRWLFWIGGGLAIAAGIVTFVWPGKTLYVIAVFVAWYLTLGGIFSIVAAFVGPKHDWWWLGIVWGVLEMALGVWAIGSPLRQVLLLVNLIGFGMVFYGISEIVAGFALKSALRRVEAVGERV